MRKSNQLLNLRFSPEFEFHTDYGQDYIENLLYDNNYDWTVTDDASVNAGWEIRPAGRNHILGFAGYKECEDVQQLIKAKAGARQGPKTGLHVHWNLIDSQGNGIMTPKQLTNIMIDWYNFKRVIELILPESRRGDYQFNLSGFNKNLLLGMIDTAKTWGENDNTQLDRMIDNHSTTACKDVRISASYNTLEFRKGIFTVDDIKLKLWVEFLRNFIGYNMKPRQKNFRKIMDNPDDRLSISHPKGLEYSFRNVWEYRAGNLGLLEKAEKRALTLARGNQERYDVIQGFTAKIKAKYNR